GQCLRFRLVLFRSRNGRRRRRPSLRCGGMIRVMAQTTPPQERPTRWLEAFNPRVPLYRDAYNEYLMCVVSAIGSVAGTQFPLYLVMALTGLWSVWVFVPACVVFELFVIFFIARPQMKRIERGGGGLR